MIFRSFIFILLSLSTSIYADTTSDMLDKLASDFVKKNMSEQMTDMHVDILSGTKNLNLPDCPAPVVAFENVQSQFTYGQQTLQISCDNPYWHVYLQVNIYGIVPVMMSKRAILQNEPIDSSSIYMSTMDSRKLQEPYFSSLKNFSDVRARNYIPANTVIRPSMLKKQYVVLHGAHLNIVFQDGPTYVSMAGIAMDDGMPGDVIRVKNATSNRIIHAEVENAMTAVVGNS